MAIDLRFLLRRRRTGPDAAPADHLSGEMAVAEPGNAFYYGYGLDADGVSANASHLLFRADGTRIWHDIVGAPDGSTAIVGDGSALTALNVAEIPGLATVATSGDYDDLINKPTISGTDLSWSSGATNGFMASSTGANATIPGATGTDAGLMTAANFTKLAGIEAGANVTDTANVTAAGALMKSEVTNLADVQGFDPADYATAAQGTLAGTATQPGDLATVATSGDYDDLINKPTISGTDLSWSSGATNGFMASSTGGNATIPGATGTDAGLMTAANFTKLAGIEAGANVTDTANVTAAGALMDSEVTNLPAVKAFDPADYATAAQGTLAGTATQPGDLATVATSGDYDDLINKPTISGTDLSWSSGATNGFMASSTGANATIPGATGTDAGLMTAANFTKLAGIEAGANVTDTANVTAAGALMKSEVTNLADVQGFDPADYAAAAHTHPASAISDSTTLGRALLLAATAAGARTDLGLGAAALEDIADGSNANGNYFEIGPFLVCWHTIDLGSILADGAGTGASPYHTNGSNWTFPRAFSANPFFAAFFDPVSAVGLDARAMNLGFTGVSTTTAFNIRAHRTTTDATATDVIALLFAAGWK